MPADLELAGKVHDKLTATRRDLAQIVVFADDGEVRLRGDVPSYHLRQLAVERTRRVAGVRNVADELIVGDA